MAIIRNKKQMENIYLKINMESQGTQGNPWIQNNLEKVEQTGGFICWLQNVLQSYRIKTFCHWHKDIHINQWSRIESPPPLLKPLYKWSNDFQQRCQDHSMGKKFFSTSGVGFGKTELSMCKTMMLDRYPPYIKIK